MKKRVVSMLIAAMMAATALAGCAGSTSSSSAGTSQAADASTAETSADAEESGTETTAEEDAAASETATEETDGAAEATEGGTEEEAAEADTDSEEATDEEGTRTVTDSDGNEVTIPAEVTRVAPAIGAFAQVTEMLTNGSGKIVAAATQQISDDFKAVFTDYVESNPNDYDATNVEDLIASGAQVVYGPKSMWTDEQLQQLDDAGIAFVSISNLSDAASMMDSFQLIGEILGEEESERADEFNAYYQGLLDDAEEKTADLTDDEKVKVLKLNVSGGAYTTVNKTDIFSDIAAGVGGVNVAADYEAADGSAAGGNGQKGSGNGQGSGSGQQGSGNGQGSGNSQQGASGSGSGQGQRGSGNGGGRSGGGPQSGLNVDAEQIIAWNPAVIITNNQASTEAILADSALQSVEAVKNGAVYTSPRGLYLWGVRSAENAMMTPWLGQILYPDRFSDVDMNSVVKDFYEKWYNTEIDDAEVEKILAGQ